MTPSRTIVFTKAAEDAERFAEYVGALRAHRLSWRDVKSMLRDVGLRPTRQRMALG